VDFSYMTLLQTTTLSDNLFKLQNTVKSVSVKEGDSVTLQINVTEIQTDDKIEWTFGTKSYLIAKINGKTSKIFDGPDGRFRDRLKLDHQTGSLIITNTRTTHSGLYEVKISISSMPTKTLISWFRLFADPESVSVTEGESVTLQTHVTELQTRDVITWTFGHPETRIALISKEEGNVPTYDDVLDGRFRNRLKLDHQTGSLTIMNTRTTDSGNYTVHIKENTNQTTYRFNLTVYGESQLHVRLFCLLFIRKIILKWTLTSVLTFDIHFLDI
uniref:Ig-like domain-containing protein n=1 Tax=Cyprinus carpio TaxID=7962 RepID=A0A8C1TA09_CYPCA